MNKIVILIAGFILGLFTPNICHYIVDKKQKPNTTVGGGDILLPKDTQGISFTLGNPTDTPILTLSLDTANYRKVDSIWRISKDSLEYGTNGKYYFLKIDSSDTIGHWFDLPIGKRINNTK